LQLIKKELEYYPMKSYHIHFYFENGERVGCYTHAEKIDLNVIARVANLCCADSFESDIIKIEIEIVPE